MPKILLVGDRNTSVTAHRAIEETFRLAARADAELTWEWPGTRMIDDRGEDTLGAYDGIWCVPASPYASMSGALKAIRFARERGVPFLGTCGGFQHAVIEFARNVANIVDADHEETNPAAAVRLMLRLSCALVEATGAVHVRPGTRAAELAGTHSLAEGYHCSFGLNAAYRRVLETAGLVVSGEDDEGDVRIVELPQHPFFLATLFQPERAALQGTVHPFVQGFLGAARQITGEATGSPSNHHSFDSKR